MNKLRKELISFCGINLDSLKICLSTIECQDKNCRVKQNKRQKCFYKTLKKKIESYNEEYYLHSAYLNYKDEIEICVMIKEGEYKRFRIPSESLKKLRNINKL